MEQKDYRLAAIMYTDIAGFSRMMETDEAGTLKLLTFHNELVTSIVQSHHGTVIKTIGDAFLVDFRNTVEALQSAMEIQDRLYERNKGNPDSPLLVRIGLHLGDIYFFENDALGEGINIAARLQSLARPGCICLSQDVYNIVLNKLEFRAEKLGKVSLKNITKEIHAFEISTPNVEFDANRDKPRPGYEPGSYLEEEKTKERTEEGIASPAGVPVQEKAAKPEPSGGDRSYTPEGSRDLLSEIRKAILEDTKTLGRRMTVTEARERYGFYGVEAQEVIATMAEQGLIIKRAPAAPSTPEPMGLPPFIAGFGRNAAGEFDPSALKSNIEAAVSGIVNEIERSVERNRSGQKADQFAEKIELRIEHERERSERHRERANERRDRRAARSGDYEAFKRQIEKSVRGARGGFVGNLTSYLAVNGFLWYINLSTGPQFLWAAIPSAAWGIGVVAGAVGLKRANAKLREIDAMPELEGEQLADYRKLCEMRDSMAQHGASTFMVIFLLAVINVLTSPAFLWFLIPSAAMLVGYLAHAASYSASKPRLERKFLASLGVKGGWKNIFKLVRRQREAVSGLGDYEDLYREAESAKEAIAAQLASGSAGPVDSELAPSLDQYLGQVRLLAQSANEIDRLVESVPMGDLAKDRAALVEKQSAASSDKLKSEYKSSIEEIDKQERSYGELKEQSEVLRLRLGSSVNQLKQMRLDMARLSASPNAEGSMRIDDLRRRTDELSHYLEDIRSGYAESNGTRVNDPFAELEAAEAKRLAEENGKSKGAIEEPKA